MERVSGNTSQDLNKLNSNFLRIAKKLFNKFKLDDLEVPLREMIRTNPITLSDIGQFDENVNHIYRFYVPTKKHTVISGTVSFLNEAFRTYQANQKDGAVETTGNTSANGSGDIMTEPGNPVEEHRHDVHISAHTHSVNVTVPAHQHGVVGRVSSTGSPSDDVEVEVNGNLVATLTRSKTQANEIDIKKFITTGWNTITCSSSSLARITIYGTIELERK